MDGWHSYMFGVGPALAAGAPTASYNQINKFTFNPGDAIAVTTQPDEARKYTVTYVVNVPAGQAPGVYVSTMSYVALGTF